MFALDEPHSGFYARAMHVRPRREHRAAGVRTLGLLLSALGAVCLPWFLVGLDWVHIRPGDWFMWLCFGVFAVGTCLMLVRADLALDDLAWALMKLGFAVLLLWSVLKLSVGLAWLAGALLGLGLISWAGYFYGGGTQRGG